MLDAVKDSERDEEKRLDQIETIKSSRKNLHVAQKQSNNEENSSDNDNDSSFKDTIRFSINLSRKDDDSIIGGNSRSQSNSVNVTQNMQVSQNGEQEGVYSQPQSQSQSIHEGQGHQHHQNSLNTTAQNNHNSNVLNPFQIAQSVIQNNIENNEVIDYNIIYSNYGNSNVNNLEDNTEIENFEEMTYEQILEIQDQIGFVNRGYSIHEINVSIKIYSYLIENRGYRGRPLIKLR